MSRASSVPPSLLFSGPRGVGKFQAAATLAKAQNCLEQDGDACGRCSVCSRIDRNEHPDVLILRPEGAGRQLKADAVRRIVADTPFRPFEGRRRVAVLVDAERMNKTAANTLLKTLEEPPPWAQLILVTSNAAALLSTILSRCQVYRFSPLAIDELTDLLVSQHGIDRERAVLLSSLSGGSLTKALEFEQEGLTDLRDEALRIAALVVDGDEEKVLVPWGDALSKNVQLQLVLQFLVGILRDVAVAAAGGVVVYSDVREEIERLAEAQALSVWLEAQVLAESALKDLRDRYLNKRITTARLMSSLNRM